MTRKLFTRYKPAAFVLIVLYLILLSGQSIASASLYVNGIFRQEWTLGKSYSSYIYASGGKSSSSYTWTKTSGTIPQGLKLEPAGKRYYLSGTPTKSGNYTFYVKVSDNYGNTSSIEKFTVKILQPVINDSMVFREGTVGKPYYNYYVRASKGVSPFKWSVSSGKLPQGLKLDPLNDRCYLKGTPTKAGNYTFYLKATDNYGNTSQAAKFTVKIATPVINLYDSLYEGTIGKPYTRYAWASGGTEPYKWTKTKGTLPPGLEIRYSGRRCYLKGTPKKAGTYNFYLKATDKYKSPSKAVKFTVTIAKPVINTYLSFWDGTVGKPYTDYVRASKGALPFKWSVSSGKLPQGLKLDPINDRCYLNGTPTKAGNYTFYLKATDNYGNATKTAKFTIKIVKPVIDVFTYFINGYVGETYYYFASAYGGTEPYTWRKVSGTMPPGLNLDYSGRRCYIKGTPKTAGTYTFKLQATDNYGTSSKAEQVTIVIKKSYRSTAQVKSNTTEHTGTNNNNSNGKSEIAGDNASAKIAVPDTNATVQVQNDDSSMADSRHYITNKVTLSIIDDDDENTNIIESGSERDEGLVKVHADKAITFEIADVDFDKISPEKFIVLYNFEPLEDITVNEEGTFTLPSDMVTGDFAVSVKAYEGNYEYESDELYIEAVSESESED